MQSRSVWLWYLVILIVPGAWAMLLVLGWWCRHNAARQRHVAAPVGRVRPLGLLAPARRFGRAGVRAARLALAADVVEQIFCRDLLAAQPLVRVKGDGGSKI
jgi:hypothetical protein